MATTVNSKTYRKLLDEDMAWLSSMPRSLERAHIRDVLRWHYENAVEMVSIDRRDELRAATNGLSDCPKCGRRGMSWDPRCKSFICLMEDCHHSVSTATVDQQQEIARLRDALQKIATWFGQFPATGRTWDDGSEMSYGAAFGSNGERDYMRGIAQKALDATYQAAAQPQPDTTPIDEAWLREIGGEQDSDLCEAYWFESGYADVTVYQVGNDTTGQFRNGEWCATIRDNEAATWPRPLKTRHDLTTLLAALGIETQAIEKGE